MREEEDLELRTFEEVGERVTKKLQEKIDKQLADLPKKGIEEIARYTVEGYGSCSVYPGYIYYYNKDGIEIYNVKVEMDELSRLEKADESMRFFCFSSSPREWGSVKKGDFRRIMPINVPEEEAEEINNAVPGQPKERVEKFAEMTYRDRLERDHPHLSHAVELLRVAKDTIVDRQERYGTPVRTFKLIAGSWGCTPKEVAIRMIEMKIVRYMDGGDYDSLIDIAGYCACLAEIHHYEKQAEK